MPSHLTKYVGAACTTTFSTLPRSPGARYSKGRTDVEHLGPRTKIVWNKTQPPLSKKLHDFCTLMHLEDLGDGGYMLITRATDHPKVSRRVNRVARKTDVSGVLRMSMTWPNWP